MKDAEDRPETQIQIGTLELPDEMMLLGGAMLAAQQLEFALYGMVAHLKEKAGKFKDLTPEEFLRGDGSKTKATLGALVKAFGPTFYMDGDELASLVNDRNLIAHDYWRMTKAKITGGRKLENPENFLFQFTIRCEKWIRLCQGWVALATRSLAESEESLDGFERTRQSECNALAYVHHMLERISAGSN